METVPDSATEVEIQNLIEQAGNCNPSDGGENSDPNDVWEDLSRGLGTPLVWADGGLEGIEANLGLSADCWPDVIRRAAGIDLTLAEYLRPALPNVSLRLPERRVLVARLSYANGGERYQTMCQNLLEAAVRRMASDAEVRARHLASGTLAELGPAVVDLDGETSLDGEELISVTIKLSRYAHSIVDRLRLSASGTVSTQKICQPILSKELEKLSNKAIEDAKEIIKRLQKS